jgi:hypothetical protein
LGASIICDGDLSTQLVEWLREVAEMYLEIAAAVYDRKPMKPAA